MCGRRKEIMNETCDDCGCEFELEEGCYIGPREGPQNTDCHPGMDFVSYCMKCAEKHGFGLERANG
jgi:hypothetical protein